jgi:LysR family transcriptional regulator, cell division regulator
MDIIDLKTFEAVARHGSMNKAAAELNTVQSNVTARVRALEEELGLQLFHRHARGVTTTPPGMRILPMITRIASLIDEVMVMARDDGEPGGALNLGCLETTMALHLSPVITQFAHTYPGVRLIVSAGTTTSLLSDVADFKLDGAFVAGPVDHPDIHQETLFTEELVLVTSTTIRSLDALGQAPDLRMIVFRLGCSFRQRLEALLTRLGILIAKPLEFSSLDVIVNCVAAGVGITLMPRRVVSAAAASGQVAIHAIPKDLGHVETLFIRRHDAYVSSATAAFLEMTRPDRKKTMRRKNT